MSQFLKNESLAALFAKVAKVTLVLFGLALVPLTFSASSLKANSTHLQATISMPAPKGAMAICRKYSWACASRGQGALSPASELELVKKINSQINEATHEISDRRQYKLPDYWALPTEAGGDCEDFALLKKRELVRLGVDPRRLLLATVLDQRRIPHAVLVYRTPNGDLLLDNQRDQLVKWAQSRYIFLRMQNPDKPTEWVGGFRQR
jgi:predicted transglutaminase-like cysteine proteinase